MRLAAGQRRWQHLRSYAFAILMCVPVTCVLSIRPSKQGARDAPRQSGRSPRFIGRHVITQGAQEVIAWISVEGFGSRQFGQSRLEARAATAAFRPSLGQLDQHSPLVATRAKARKKLIDANLRTSVSLGHFLLFLMDATA